MRIIAGKHRGTNLLSPEGLDTRPTPQRVREAVFSMLESGRFGTVLRDRVVLDLFAGTGAMGLEALSRGAERVVLVDNHPTALDALRANVEKLRVGGRAQVRSGDATRWHERALVGCGVIFMDPPYGSEAWVPALAAALKGGWIGDDTVVVIETDRRERTEIPDGFEVLDERTYGRARILMLGRASDGSDESE
ncbi:16S rRNA (guanine(966)-N(2))-methyltransferase RsmD [Thalassobaculum sp. OXR-137]|uniref:16S rRNA (guanine(966)-N(2))-methyltransferase RsmD n=1 Tax=Thalassobaculum sp. OXR-137 TaxID=3100173 RepID=UPI002AC9C149|nr:16S rRNA (guanine(966)-N(2))-methyltransferase RsmD [Thalassobaculum sp. OXR-137]WPZ35765.1 16S rRNA (guanine(966)-N(2))-methyltransferase RsmD [Thalassobaculum sp. OXR-137]